MKDNANPQRRGNQVFVKKWSWDGGDRKRFARGLCRSQNRDRQETSGALMILGITSEKTHRPVLKSKLAGQ
jgi:hypothetical protein